MTFEPSIDATSTRRVAVKSISNIIGTMSSWDGEKMWLASLLPPEVMCIHTRGTGIFAPTHTYSP